MALLLAPQWFGACTSDEPSGNNASGSGGGGGQIAQGGGGSSTGGGSTGGGSNDGACDPFQQDCPVGQKCAAYASSGNTWDANKCVEITGEDGPGDECTYAGVADGSDSCGAGLMCWSVDEEAGTCIELCKGTAEDPICSPGASCSISNQGSVVLCSPGCDPLLQTCPSGEACYWNGDSFMCAPTTADIPLGKPCEYLNHCATGLMCFEAAVLPDCGGAMCCAKYCDLNDPVCPQAGTKCEPFFLAAPPGYESAGACVISG